MIPPTHIHHAARFNRLSGTRRISVAGSLRIPVVLSLTALLLNGPAMGETIGWDFATMSPSSTVANLTASAVTQHANNGNTTTPSGTSPSSGYAGSSGGNNAAAATKASSNPIVVNDSTAFEFTLTPASGYQFALTGISFGSRGTGSGPTAYSLRSSVDAYATDLGSGALEANSTWTLKSNSGITLASSTPVTFRLFAYSGTGSLGTSNWRIDDLNLTVTNTLTGPADTTSPVLVSKTPETNSSTSIPTTELTLTYDETILANTGTVTVKKFSDNSIVETITVPSAAVSVSGSTATINPSVVLAYNTGYYAEVSAGAFKDSAGNPSPATVWSFATRTAPQIIISQYHEGEGSADRYVELKNLTGSPILMTNYRLAVWSDTAPSDNEGWKSGAGTTTRVTPLDGFTIPANGYFLVAQTGAAAPGYAASNSDLGTPGSGSATSFDGDDSVVLYSGAGFTQPEIVDAVSISAIQGADKSFYRITDDIGFDFSAGTSILDYPATWGTKTVAEVNAATSGQAWYLRAAVASELLSLGITPTSFLESASATNAATATVTRSGPTTNSLDVTISINDPSEASVQETIVTIPAEFPSAQFPIGAVNDAFKDGDKIVTITVSAPLFVPASQQITVLDDPADPAIPIVINEVDADPPGADTAEFVELYNNSNQPVDLDGLVLVFYNGGDDTSYMAIDLTGFIAANGYLVVGNPGVPNVSIFFQAGDMQNGPDAVALYAGAAFQFSSRPVTAFTTATLLDAVVYDTNDADDTGLIDALTPLKPQVDEGGTSGTNSIARVPNGGTAFDTSLYVAQTPTPGVSNVAGNTFGTWAAANAGGVNASPTDDFDKDGVTNGVEYFFGATGSTFTPSPQANAAGLISYPHPTATPGTSYVVRTSPDLVNWSLPVTTTESGGFVNYTIPPGQGKIFLRLEVVVGP